MKERWYLVLLTISLVFSINFSFSQIPTSGLVAYYPFTDGSLNDFSGNNYHGSNNGSTGYIDRFGHTNNARYFDGHSNIVINNTQGLHLQSAYSVSAWVNFTQISDPSGTMAIFSKHRNYSFNGFALSITSGGQFYSYLGGYGQFLSSPLTNYNDNKWHFVAATYSPSTEKLYVDGVLVNSISASYQATNDENFRIGSTSDIGFFSGVLDDIRIYNRALTDAEVSALYQAEKPPFDLTSGLVAYYPFNNETTDGSGNRFTSDESGNGNNGTVNGPTLTTDRFGNVNKAYSFGFGKKIIVPNSVSLNSETWSVSAWYKTSVSDDGTAHRITTKQTDNTVTNNLAILFSTGQIYGSAYDPRNIEIQIRDNNITSDNNWHHVVYIRNHSNNLYYLYIDNILRNTVSDYLNVLTNNAPLYIGGCISDGNPWLGELDDIRIYNRALTDAEVNALYQAEKPADPLNKWVRKADFPGGGRDGATGFSLGNKGYMMGGYLEPLPPYTAKNDFWEYDPASNKWTQLENFPGLPRSTQVSFTIGNKAYVGLGGNAVPQLSFYNDLWEYDALTKIWTQKESFPGLGRSAPVAFKIGNKAYVGTGVDVNWGMHNDFYEFDPSVATNQWRKIADLPAGGRYGAFAFSIGNKGYVTCGDYNHTTLYTDLWEYDPQNNTWTRKAEFPSSNKIWGTAFSINSKGYIGLGGRAGMNSNYQDFWEYDPSTNSWAQIDNFGGAPREQSFSFVIGSTAYVGSGVNVNMNFFSDFWSYSLEPINNQPPEEVTIGTQTWMKKNLDVAYYRDGTEIRYAPTVADWLDAGSKSEGAWCYYDNNSTNGTTYGRLYNWYAVHSDRGLAPVGWKIPTESDWSTLITSLGGESVAGGKMKETGIAHWQDPNVGATNESGFSSLPGGWRWDDSRDNGLFTHIYEAGYWWTNNEINSSSARYVGQDHGDTYFRVSNSGKKVGYSVRCIKDAPVTLSTGLVAHYKFENNLKDETGKHDAEPTSGSQSYTTGIQGQCIMFDGVFSFIKAPMGNDVCSSVSLWYKSENPTSNYPTLIGAENQPTMGGYFFQLLELGNHPSYSGREGKLAYHLYQAKNDGNSIESNSLPALNQWHHVVAVFDKSTSKQKIYIDGVLDSQVDNNINLLPLTLTIGCMNPDFYPSPSYTNNMFKGLIDEVRIYDRPLQPEEVSAIYETEKPTSLDVTFTLVDGTKEGHAITYDSLTIFKVYPNSSDNNLKNNGIMVCKFISSDHPSNIFSLYEINNKITNTNNKFSFGDNEATIRFEAKVYEKNAIKPNLNNKQRILFKVFMDNGDLINNSGDYNYNVISNESKVIKLLHTTLKYNLTVSLEWNADQNYINWLKQQFRYMSNCLYDVFDGQLTLDSILIFNNKINWENSDLHIRASNFYMFWSQQKSMWITGAMADGFGAYKSSSYINISRNIYSYEEKANYNLSFNNHIDYHPYISMLYKAMAHEFLHYTLGMLDEYESENFLDYFFYQDFNLSILDHAIGIYDSKKYQYNHKSSELSNSLIYSEYPKIQNNQKECWSKTPLIDLFSLRFIDNIPTPEIQPPIILNGNFDCWNYFEKNFERRLPNSNLFLNIIKPDERSFDKTYNYLVLGPDNELSNPNVPQDVHFNDNDVIAYGNPDYIVKFQKMEYDWFCLCNVPKDVTTNIEVNLIKSNNSEIKQGKTSDKGLIYVLGVENGDKIRVTDKNSFNTIPNYYNKIHQIILNIQDPKKNENPLSDNEIIITLDAVADSLNINFDIACLNNGNKKIVCKSNRDLPELPSLEINNNGVLDTLNFTNPSQNKYEVILSSGYFTSSDLSPTFYAKDLQNNQFFVPLSIKNLIFTKQTGMIYHDGLQLSLDTNNVFSDVLIQSNNFKPLTDGIDSLNYNLGKIYNIHSCSNEVLTGSNRMIISFGSVSLPDSMKPLVRIYLWDEIQNKWVYYGGTPDTSNNIITTDFNQFGTFALFTIYGFPIPTTNPIKILPSNLSTVNCHPTKFKWNKVTNANRYEIIVSDVSDFSHIVIDQNNVTDTVFNYPLNPVTTYYWTVKAYGAYGETGWSDVWSFSTKSISLTTPIAGNLQNINKPINIQYTQTGVNFISLDYSADNGNHWTNIVQNEPASGTHSWKADLPTGCNYKLKIYDSENLEVADTTGIFSVNGVKLVTPTAGLQLHFNDKYNITWTQCGIQDVKLEYSTNNGTNWTVIIFMTSASSGIYQWTVPSIASDKYLLRISDVLNPEISDVTNGNFTVTKYPEFKINVVDKMACSGKSISLGNIDSLGIDQTITGGSGKFKVTWVPSRLYYPNTTNPMLTVATASTKYTISVTDVETGQQASATMRVLIDVPPSVKIKTTTLKPKTGENVYLKDYLQIQGGILPYGYFWTNKSDWTSKDPNPSFSTIKAGTYKFYVTLTDSNSCVSNECAFSLTIYPKSGRVVISGEGDAIAGETGDEDLITVFPNPATDLLYINAAFNDKLNAELRITNILGQDIVNLSYQNNNSINEEIDISKWSAGVYTLQLIYGSQVFVYKVIKE